MKPQTLRMAVLPEHLHAIWRLPPDDADYPLRWLLIKAGFSRRLAKGEHICASRQAKRERGIWQRRYLEHQIRDEIDLARHVDYIHYNHVKYGWSLALLIDHIQHCMATLSGEWQHRIGMSKLGEGIDSYGER